MKSKTETKMTAVSPKNSHFLSVGDVDSRVASRRSSYIEILGNIASELDMMLTDLCEVFPDSNEAVGSTSDPKSPGRKRQISDEVFEDYISCASDGGPGEEPEAEENGGADDLDDTTFFKRPASDLLSAMDVLPPSSHGGREIDLLDRLIRTHPVWYQPTTQSVAALHMLQGRNLGSFIVHQSKEPDCMTLAVRISENGRCVIKDFAIQNTKAGVKLTGFNKVFDTVPKLIAHLCKSKENLPIPLFLPKPIAYAQSVQELSAIGLLGPDFWTSLMNRSSTLSAQDMSQLSFNRRSNSYRTEMLVPVSEKSESSDDEEEKIYNSDTLGSTTKISDPFTDKVTLPKKSYTLPAGQMKFMNPAFFPCGDNMSEQNFADQRPNSLDFSSSKASSQTKENYGKRFPAPKSAPPPPPVNQTPALFTQTRILRNDFGQVPERLSGDYYKPYEVTRQDHIPPSSFEIYMNRLPSTVPPPSDSTPPPIPPKRRSAIVSSTKPIVDPYAAPVITTEPIGVKPSSDPYSVSPHSLTPTSLSNHRNTWSSERSSVSSENSTGSRVSQSTLCSEYSTTSSRTSVGFSSDISTISADSNNSGVSSLLDKVSDTAYYSNRTSYSSTNSGTPTLASDLETNKGKMSLLDVSDPSMRIFNSGGILEPVRTPSPTSSPRMSSLSDFDPLSVGSPTVTMNNGDSERTTQVGPVDTWGLEKPSQFGSIGNGSSEISLRSNWETFNDSVRFDKSMLQSMRASSTCATRDSTASSIASITSYSLSPGRDSVTSSLLSRDSVFTDVHEDDIPTTLDDINVPQQRERLSAMTRKSSQVSGDSSGTVFSNPWDSSIWEDIYHLGGTKHQPNFPSSSNQSTQSLPDIIEDVGEKSAHMESRRTNKGRSVKKSNSQKSLKNNKSNERLMMSIFYLDDDHTMLLSSDEKENQAQKVAGPRRLSAGLDLVKRLKLPSPMKRRKQDPSRKIQSYIIKMSTNMTTTFGCSVANFIQCTKEGNETNPTVIMRNTRQFMDGMKHHLLQEDFQFQHKLRSHSADEPINEDAIIEGALHKCVIKPLKSFIYKWLLQEYSNNGSIQLLNRNLKIARTKTAEELGVRPVFIPPQGASMQVLQHFFTKMYKAYSPLSMMDCLLKAVETIYKATQDTRPGHEAVHSMGADDFLPVFIYVLAHCDAQTAEIDADYMWGLLDPSLMLGQPGYYLTTFSSAIHVIKNLHLEDSSGDGNGIRLPCISDMQGFMKIAFKDEGSNAMMSKTLPITPNMTTADVCQMISRKLEVNAPKEYALYLIVEDEERELDPKEIPQQLKADLHAKEKVYMFGYRKKSTKVVWPTQM